MIRNINWGFIREAAVEAATSLCMVVIVPTYRGDPAVELPCVFHAVPVPGHGDHGVPVPDHGDPPTHPGGITQNINIVDLGQIMQMALYSGTEITMKCTDRL